MPKKQLPSTYPFLKGLFNSRLVLVDMLLHLAPSFSFGRSRICSAEVDARVVQAHRNRMKFRPKTGKSTLGH